MSHLLYPLFGTGPLLGKLLRRPFELISDGDAPGLGLVQYLAGVFRKTGSHGVGLPSLEEQQIFVRPGFVKGVVHIPFPSHPVKQLGIAGQLDAGCSCAVSHELFHALLAVGRLLGPVMLGDFPSHTSHYIGKAPGGQLGRLYGNGNRAPGNIFIYQSNHPLVVTNSALLLRALPPEIRPLRCASSPHKVMRLCGAPQVWDKLSRSVVIAPVPPSSGAAVLPPARNGQ